MTGWGLPLIPRNAIVGPFGSGNCRAINFFRELKLRIPNRGTLGVSIFISRGKPELTKAEEFFSKTPLGVLNEIRRKWVLVFCPNFSGSLRTEVAIDPQDFLQFEVPELRLSVDVRHQAVPLRPVSRDREHALTVEREDISQDVLLSRL